MAKRGRPPKSASVRPTQPSAENIIAEATAPPTDEPAEAAAGMVPGEPKPIPNAIPAVPFDTPTKPPVRRRNYAVMPVRGAERALESPIVVEAVDGSEAIQRAVDQLQIPSHLYNFLVEAR